MASIGGGIWLGEREKERAPKKQNIKKNSKNQEEKKEMEKLLITPAEVVELAFGGDSNMAPEVVPQRVIRVAQTKLLRPVVGAELYQQIGVQPYAHWFEEWGKLPLALYVKWLMLPTIATRVGMSGVVTPHCDNYRNAESHDLRRVMIATRSEADALMDRAIEELENHPDIYQHYSPEENVRNKVRIVGGVVM